MNKDKRNKIIKQVKADRSAHRKLEIETQAPIIHAKVHKTHKKDYQDQQKNTIRADRYEN